MAISGKKNLKNTGWIWKCKVFKTSPSKITLNITRVTKIFTKECLECIYLWTKNRQSVLDVIEKYQKYFRYKSTKFLI